MSEGAQRLRYLAVSDGWCASWLDCQAAYAGAGQRLLLLDEVDAALDEPNQARVAALLKQLTAGSGAASCQILAITHNAAFQAAGRIIQVPGPGPRCIAYMHETSSLLQCHAYGSGLVKQCFITRASSFRTCMHA